jgi:RNA polymerase sigma-70 factor (ECF subfamily)
MSLQLADSPRSSCSSRALPRGDHGHRDDQLRCALREHRATLARAARTLCGNQADADDLLHDVYERALRARRRDGEHSNLRAWLHSILRNLFIDRCRHARRHPTPLPIDDLELEGPFQDPAEDTAAWQSVSTSQLHHALAKLSPEFRRVFELHTFEGLRYDEIAARLAIAPSTVGTRLSRARAKLRTSLLRTLDEGATACAA